VRFKQRRFYDKATLFLGLSAKVGPTTSANTLKTFIKTKYVTKVNVKGFGGECQEEIGLRDEG
jgi:hypothetical protein